MRNAVKDVIEAKMGYLKASKEYGMPHSTLEARVSSEERRDMHRKGSREKYLFTAVNFRVFNTVKIFYSSTTLTLNFIGF